MMPFGSPKWHQKSRISIDMTIEYRPHAPEFISVRGESASTVDHARCLPSFALDPGGRTSSYTGTL